MSDYRTPPTDMTCCERCGAAVFSTKDHDAWHAQMDALARLVLLLTGEKSK